MKLPLAAWFVSEQNIFTAVEFLFLQNVFNYDLVFMSGLFVENLTNVSKQSTRLSQL